MNKILISALAVVGIAGGGYYFITQEHIDTVASYLPEPISSFIFEQSQAEKLAIQQEAPPMPKQIIAGQPDVQNNPIVSNKSVASPVVNKVVINEQNISVNTTVSDDDKEAALAAVKKIDAKITSNLDQDIDINKKANKKEVEEVKVSMKVNSQQATPATKVEKKSVARDVKIKETPEVLKLESELKSVQKNVMQIDGENKMLQARFQKILKKNRDLALELKRINDKIQVTN